jgi:hypothetical protein
MGVRKLSSARIAFGFALASFACALGIGAPPAARAAGPLVIVMQNGSPAPSPLVLYDQQFIAPFGNSAFLSTSEHHGSASWTLNGASIALAKSQPGLLAIGGDAIATAAPGNTWITTTRTYGPSTLTVRDGSATASLTVYHFAPIEFRCQFRYTPAFVFDPDRANSGDMQHPDTYDLYVTEPASASDRMDPCYGSALVTGTRPMWHMPSGGVVIPISNDADFIAITPKQFIRPVTSVPVSQRFVALLLRTREGRFVKLTPPGPLVEISDAHGHFPF